MNIPETTHNSLKIILFTKCGKLTLIRIFHHNRVFANPFQKKKPESLTPNVRPLHPAGELLPS
jgi:hypothetical protein